MSLGVREAARILKSMGCMPGEYSAQAKIQKTDQSLSTPITESSIEAVEPLTNLFDTRRTKMRLLIEKYGRVGLSELLGYTNSSFIVQMAGPNPTRDISERTARKIEELLSLPFGWFDQSEHPLSLRMKSQDVAKPCEIVDAEFRGIENRFPIEINSGENLRVELLKAQLRLESIPKLERELEACHAVLETERRARMDAECIAAVAEARLEWMTARMTEQQSRP